MAYPTEVLADSPIGYWRLDETSGTTAADSSGNGRDGTIVGGVTLGDLSCPTGGGMVFNGSTGYITLGIQAAFGFTGATDPFTIEAWLVRTSGSAQNSVAFSNGDNGWTTRYEVNDWAAIRRHTSGWQAVTTTDVAEADQWDHVVWTYDGTTLRTYVNGVANNTSTNTNDTLDPGYRTMIGAMPESATQSRFWNGKIADCAIYDTALSGARILAHYRAGIGMEGDLDVTLDAVTLEATDIYALSLSGTLDPVLLAADAEVFFPIEIDMPSIDGATTLLGVESLETSALQMPSIDGASGIVGPILALATPAEIDMPSIDGAIPLNGIQSIATSGAAPSPAYTPAVTAQILSSSGTVLATVTEFSALSWTDSLNEPGSGSISIPLSVAASAQLAAGRFVRCRYEGVTQFTFLIEGDPSINLIAQGEEFDEVVEANGRGWVSVLEQARMYPYGGTENPLNPQYRIYNFASYDFPNSGSWKVSEEQGMAGTVLTDLGRYVIGAIVTPAEEEGEEDLEEPIDIAAPIGFPVRGARWIWPVKDSQKVGYGYFRRRITITEEAEYRIAASGDNFYTVYLDGSPIIGEDEVTSCWTEFKVATVRLKPGQYQLAAVVQNIPARVGVNNPAGFVCAIYTVDLEEQVETVVDKTSANWRGLAYSKTTPGWTAGQILRFALNEAKARGVLTGVTLDFTDTADSNGDPWEIIPQLSVPIGSTLFEVVTSLASEGWIDYRMKPGSLRLEVFNADTAGTSSGVTFTEGVDIEELSINETEQFINTLLVKWPNGYFEQEDAASVATYGRREGYATFDVPTKVEAARRATELLRSLANVDPAIAMTVVPTAGKKPYTNFRVGDRITAPNASGGTSSYRVWSISITVDEMGDARVVLEVARRLRLRQREFVSLIENLGAGVVGEITSGPSSDLVATASATADRLGSIAV